MWCKALVRVLNDEELKVLRNLRSISRPRKRLGYMRKIMVISSKRG